MYKYEEKMYNVLNHPINLQLVKCIMHFQVKHNEVEGTITSLVIQCIIILFISTHARHYNDGY